MSYPKLRIAGREILALIPMADRDCAAKHRFVDAVPEMQRLIQAARAETDAVAFAFVRGQWYAAA